MKDRIFEKIALFTGLIPIGGIFGVIAFLANIEIADFDLWLHLGMGKFISEHHIIPRVDILSCTIAGKEWINHEWLFQVVVYNVYQFGGMNALLWMQSSIVLLTLLLLLILGYNRDKQFIATCTLILVSMVYLQRFTVRPDIFSLLFFVIYIFILALHIDKWWASIVLFIIQILWTNMHGFFFFGPLFILIGIISELIKRKLPLPYEWNKTGRLTDQELKRLIFCFFLTIGACLINPHTFKGAWYPLNVFFSISGDHKIFFEHIQELRKPIPQLSDFLDFTKDPFYKLLIILSSVSFVFNRRSIDISALLFWLVFLIFSLKASRNLAFFALAAYLVIVTNFMSISLKNIVPLRFTGKHFQSITLTAFNILLIFWIFNFAQKSSTRGYYDFDRNIRKSEFKDVSLKNLPYKAVNFLIENKIEGNFFNDFNSGAYLVGRTFPYIKVFIDGRTEVYGVDFFNQYRDIWSQGNVVAFDKIVNEKQLTGVFLNSAMQSIHRELIKHVFESPDWKLVYFDHDAVIFLKNTEINKKWTDHLAIDLKNWKVTKAELKKIGAIDAQPYQNYYRASNLELLDLDDAALEEAKEELKLDPRYSDNYELIGKLYTKRKDYKSAFEYFRMAAMMTPSNLDRRHNLAMVYSDLTEYDYAIREYRNIIKAWPQDPKAYFFIAKNYIKVFDYQQGLKFLHKGIALDGSAFTDVLKIGDQLMEQGGYEEAKEAFDIALKINKDAFTVHRKLAALYKATGAMDKAKEELKKALQEKNLKPEDIESVKKELDELG